MTNATCRKFARLIVCLAATTIAAASAHAQSALHDDVRRAALDYLEGFYEGDTVKLIRSVRPDVSKYGFDLPRNSATYVGETMKWDEFLSYARRIKAGGRATPATAPKEVLLLDVQDQTAAVKVTAWWGTDYLLLGRYDGRWMISHVLWQSAPRKAP
ncbi:MAG: nuclear transport factor 2 family protein [Gemmatimonadaceae bacterium]|nr:nuclear transport factor 2 family protein [Gemmatimonadaceae bacterium]